MAMKYTKMPSDAFQKLQLNAGIMVDSFTPETGVIGNILGATSGGINFASNPTFEDFGEDVDNCPPNMKELKRLTGFDPTMSGTFLTCTPAIIKTLVGAAVVDVDVTSRVVPQSELVSSDFGEVWWIGDYSDQNTGESAGFIAIHLINALNQTGFQIQSGKNAKGQMGFEFHAHYSLSDQETVPFEIYCKTGTETVVPSVLLNKHVLTLADETTETLVATVIPAGQTVTWSSASTSKATVSNGLVTAKDAGSTIITAAITVDGVTYNDTCTVIITG